MYLFKADFLNQNCHCSTLDTAALPAFFSPAPHFLSRKDLDAIAVFISTYEDFLQVPAVRKNLLQNHPAGFPTEFSQKGVFNSYDFHISASGPQLIEINSNAGGALLSMLAAENILPCCDAMEQYIPDARMRFDKKKLVKMFRDEFALRFADRPLGSVAIVDETPESQFFYPEFLLTQELLRSEGLEAHIVSPLDLQIIGGVPYAGKKRIDFIYNRLTDFYFEQETSRVLREIYQSGIAVVSPNPLVHTLYARKSNLVKIWDDNFAAAVPGARLPVQALRLRIPEARRVTAENQQQFWRDRRDWFFKPTDGFGGKGVYRGDKVTKKVWDYIISNGYIAQRYIAPRERHITATEKLKYDIRVYTYGREILGVAARYYQGQTTNFRTPNGGLATVLVAA